MQHKTSLRTTTISMKTLNDILLNKSNQGTNTSRRVPEPDTTQRESSKRLREKRKASEKGDGDTTSEKNAAPMPSKKARTTLKGKKSTAAPQAAPKVTTRRSSARMTQSVASVVPEIPAQAQGFDDAEEEGHDDPYDPDGDRDSEGEHDEGDFVDEDELEDELAEVVNDKMAKSKRSTTAKHGGEGAHDFILPAMDSLDMHSDASSLFDVPLDDEDEEEDVDNNNHPMVQVNAQQVTSRGRDAKYEAERPRITPTSGSGTTLQQKRPVSKPESVESANVASNVDARDPNSGWDVSTHMVYPSGQRQISKRQQPQALQDVMDEAIVLNIGLFLFSNTFPQANEQLEMAVLSLNTACTNKKQPQILYRIERDKNYRKHLSNYVVGRAGHMRSQVKEAASSIVPGMYDIVRLSEERRTQVVKGLMDRLTYVFPLSDAHDPSSWASNRPYHHPAIIAVLKKAFFDTSKAVGKRYLTTYTSTSKKSSAPELPMPMVALTGVAIFASLKEWSTGTQIEAPFSGTEMSEEYENHLQLFKEKIIRADDSGREKYHTLMSFLYREVVGTRGSSVRANAQSLPDIDFDGMDG
ncbi:hypothetical protein K435DRAFT_879301 [Dendrothele bispora CBS 962.96]|uniref:DUF6532 domain-containing protein n=1 Tax=Dendrothele bispora (strain CBS 962.96) TaxID=1314807 RepID=A0A4S8KLH3_DENBC|nr:hypothetical protein K435DRAFT_879301 [Dendrothele bispora CBS 962.96]